MFAPHSPSRLLVLAATSIMMATTLACTINIIQPGATAPGSSPATPASPSQPTGAAAGPSLSTQGLVAHFPFDGNAASADGTAIGRLVGGVTFESGRIGQAARLLGGSDNPSFIQVPNNASLGLSKSFTLAAFVKPDKEPENGSWPVITKGKHKEDYTLWYTKGGPDVLLNWQTPTELWPHRETSATNYAKANEWQHLAATFDGAKVRFYLNGAYQTDADWRNTVEQSGEDLYIGASFPGSLETFAGAVDDVRLYNRALSGTEVQGLNALK